jgi:parvulin-like peptidyl-prolyl isomerase
MKWMAKLNKPWLHFIVLGMVFFKLQGALFPEPKTQIGPLSEARIKAMQQQWYTSTGQQPSPRQNARLIAVELDRDMLLQRALELDFHLYDTIVYQRLIRNMNFLQLAEGKSKAELFDQALEMRLHLDDTVIKRRLIQVVENQLLADNRPAKPTAAQIAAEFARRAEELRRPPRYSIEHIFFNRERESEAPSVIATITERKLDIDAARHLSSLFLQGYQFTRETPGQLAQKFGRDFVLSLEQAKPQAEQWLGPIRSAFGLHYVWVNAVEPTRDARLEEVEQQLRNDLQYSAQAQALQNAIAALRDDFDIQGQDIKGQNVTGLDVTGLDLKGLDEKGLSSKTKEVRE